MNQDLNLLVALDAMLSEGSVSAAAERLNVSVPAMSRTLARARRMIGDPLFVRAGRGLVPTPRAEALREGTRALVHQAQQLLRPDEAFDPRTWRATFTIRTDDGMVSTLAPRLLGRLEEIAPLVTVRFAAQGQQDVIALREGHVDLDIGVIPDLGPEIVRQLLFRDRFVAALRDGHPLARGRKPTAAQFAACGHVTVSRRGLLTGPVDVALAKEGLSRRIRAVTTTFTEALAIARATDLVATVAERLTQGSLTGLTTRPLPVATPDVPISQAWHPRFSADPGHKLVRSLVHALCAELGKAKQAA